MAAPKKKKPLPFKTQPKKETKLVGDEVSGILEIPVFGDVTVREQAWITERLSNQSTFRETARVANKISRAEKGFTPMGAHSLVTRCVTTALSGESEFTQDEENLRIKYSREIDELIQYLLDQQWRRQLVTAAALVRFRVKGQETFDEDDARDLPNQLVTDLYGLAMLEQNRATFETEEEELSAEIAEEQAKAAAKEEKELEEDLKK